MNQTLVVLLLLATGALAQDNRLIRLDVAANATVVGLLEKETRRDWLAPGKRPFATIKKGGRYFPATGLTRHGALWRVEFGSTEAEVDLRVTVRPRYLLFEVARVKGDGIEELRFAELQVACAKNNGWWAGTCWNDQFAVGLFGLSDRVHVQLRGNGNLAASLYSEFGIEGEGVALVAAPTNRFLDIVEEVERDCRLPSPRLGGRWAKRSPAVKTSYLFTDLTETNADETIRYAKLGGFKYIMIYESNWSKSLGSYPINTNHFPRGEPSLKAVVDKCHAAGLKVGLHFLTSFVSKHDPLVRPVPDPRLLKDDRAVLTADIDEHATEIAADSLATFPTEGAFYGDNKAGFDIQIDNEIIQYRAIGTNTFLKCLRGFAGTKAAPHKAGATIHHLVERYGCYLADLRTTLKNEISERIAGLINRCGFDMVYFDGGECNSANGPYWYWVSQQQDDVCRRFKREVLVQGSGGTQWTWHWFARGCCDDFAAIAPKPYLDCHKIADSWEHYTQSFMPAELGWWGFLAAEPDHPATTPDEVEYYAVRMLALNTPVSLETSLSALQRNGRTEEMLALLASYERLRLRDELPTAIRQQLRTGEWHRVGNRFVPIRYDTQYPATSGHLTATNTFGAQPLRLRLQAVPTLAAPGDSRNLTLLYGEHALGPTNGPMPGALARRITFDHPLNLLHHRALAVTLRVETPTNAVLNVQLEAAGKTYRDHYIDLNFTGEKTIVIPEPTTERMLPEFRPAHANYAFKAAMYGFQYQRIVALNLRWMRASAPCRILRVEALAESETVLKDPSVTLGNATLIFPATLKTGDYIEFWGGNTARLFDRNGHLLASVTPLGPVPLLATGANELTLNGNAKLTVITIGNSGLPSDR